MKFHPNGTSLASGSDDKRIKVFDLRSNRLTQNLNNKSQVWSIAFDPAGLYILAASNDGKIRVHDLRKGKVLKALHGHNLECYSVTFSRLGDYFCSGGSDKKITLWKSNFPDRSTTLLHYLDATGMNRLLGTNECQALYELMFGDDWN